MSYLCPHCNRFPLEVYVWWVSGEKSTGGVQFVEKSTTGGNRTGFWLCKLGKVLSRPRCSKAAPVRRAEKVSRIGLREFVRVDNERALDVGAIRRGTGTFQVQKPKVPEGGSDVTVRESPDVLTSRAEEVNTSKALISVDRIEPGRWGRLLVDGDWYAFCQALYKGIEGEDWEDMYDSYKVMSKAVGVKKPQEAQKAKALWAMKAA